MSPRLLEGDVIDVETADPQVAELERENRALRQRLAVAELEAKQAKDSATFAVGALRKQLSPLYRALQSVFGEMDSIAGDDDVSPASAVGGRDARQIALWNDWKAKLTPACGKVIDALLLHADLSVKQIRATAHLGENTVYQATSRLGQLGLVSKSGGRFSLKQL